MRDRSSSSGRCKYSTLFIIQAGSIVQSPLIQFSQEALFPRVKRPRREADHLFTTNVEVKSKWIYMTNPQYVMP